MSTTLLVLNSFFKFSSYKQTRREEKKKKRENRGKRQQTTEQRREIERDSITEKSLCTTEDKRETKNEVSEREDDRLPKSN